MFVVKKLQHNVGYVTFLYTKRRTGVAVGQNCYMEWHDECMFGLCRKDMPFFGMSISDWRLPADAAKQ
jgi:hypothetical protein